MTSSALYGEYERELYAGINRRRAERDAYQLADVVRGVAAMIVHFMTTAT
jgi:hypothetical protein